MFNWKTRMKAMQEALQALEGGDTLSQYHKELVFLQTYNLLSPKKHSIGCSKSIYPRYRYSLNEKGEKFRDAFLKLMKIIRDENGTPRRH
jgi:hypothetical protein